MAKASKPDDIDVKKPKTTRKKNQTVRERSARNTGSKKRRLKTTASKIKSPFKKVRGFGKREYNVVPLPDTGAGRILNKRVRIIPGFVKDAWKEIRQVTWPNRHETIRLTFAVFTFAVIFAAVVGILDYGLDKLFKQVILK